MSFANIQKKWSDYYNEIFCNEKCSVGNIDGSFYHDDDHLNLLGANNLPVLEEN